MGCMKDTDVLVPYMWQQSWRACWDRLSRSALLLGEPSSVCFWTLLVNEAPSAVWKAVPMTQRDVR